MGSTNKGWTEAADYTGKAPEHVIAATKADLTGVLRMPMKTSKETEPKIRDTKVKNALYQGHTYRAAIEDSISNQEVELKGGRVRIEGNRFTFLDKDNNLLSDPVYENKFWLEAYHDGRLIKLPLNRAEVDYYNKLKSEYKKPERKREPETSDVSRFNLQDRVDNAKKAIQDWRKLNDIAMVNTWKGYLAERELELFEFDKNIQKYVYMEV